MRGFTLVELLVAIAILALISAMALRGLESVISTRERIGDEAKKWRDVGLFFARFEADLSALEHRPGTDASGLVQPEFVAKGGLSGQYDANLIFTRASRDGSSRIGYRFLQGRMEEVVWNHVDEAQGASPRIYPLLDHVSGFALRYLSINNVWVPYWPLQAQPRPKAVEATLILDSGEKIVRIFALI